MSLLFALTNTGTWVLINIHRKDVHVKVSDCIPLKAFLKPNYSYCDDFLVTFKNEQVNPTGSVYTWDFGDNTTPVTTTDIEGRYSTNLLIPVLTS
jgi:hypothetical protein